MRRSFNPVKALILTGIPLLIIFFKVFIRFLLGLDYFSQIGVTLASLGLGQIFPFIVFDNLILSKILSTKTDYTFSKSEFKVKYRVELAKSTERIESLKAITLIVFFTCFMLFMICVYFGSTGNEVFSSVFGSISVLIVWSYLIFI